MRTTIHLVSARDCLTLAPLLHPVRERNFWTGSPFGRQVKGVDVEAVLAAGRALLDEQPRTNAQLRAFMAERFPDYDATSLGYAVHHLVPVVQVPPRGVWGQKGLPTWATTETWLGRPVEQAPSIDQVVLRYLAAFGPAGTMDVQAWSGLTRLREVTDRLRPRLRSFRNEAGKELFDLPDAPRPDPDTPAPVRFLPQYDNVALSHADRSHLSAGAAARWPTDDLHWSALLVDGFVAGAWRLVRDRKAATLVVRLLGTARRPRPGRGGRGRRTPARLPRPRRRDPRGRDRVGALAAGLLMGGVAVLLNLPDELDALTLRRLEAVEAEGHPPPLGRPGPLEVELGVVVELDMRRAVLPGLGLRVGGGKEAPRVWACGERPVDRLGGHAEPFVEHDLARLRLAQGRNILDENWHPLLPAVVADRQPQRLEVLRAVLEENAELPWTSVRSGGRW